MTRLLVCAGEASGDRLAADLLVELERRRPRLAARGLAGPRLRNLGVEAIANAEDVSVVGIVEAALALPRIWGIMNALEAALDRWKPDLVLTVDSPDLMLRFARRVRSRGLKVVHWVSPQVWAWRPGRVRTVAASVDRLICLFPHEPPLYAGTGLDVVYAGHPAVDRVRHKIGVREWVQDAEPSGAIPPVFGLAPGSRESEVRALWPVLREVAKRLRERAPDARFVVPVAPTVRQEWMPGVEGAVFVDDISIAGSAADVVVTCSGTATLELAALRVPMVVIYRTHPLTWMIGRWLVRGVRHIALPNILAGEMIAPEHLQHLDPDAIAAEAWSLLGAGGDTQRARLGGVVAPLGGGAIGRTADAVEALLPPVSARKARAPAARTPDDPV